MLGWLVRLAIVLGAFIWLVGCTMHAQHPLRARMQAKPPVYGCTPTNVMPLYPKGMCI